MPAVLEAGIFTDLMLQQGCKSLGWNKNILPALLQPPAPLKPHKLKTRQRILEGE